MPEFFAPDWVLYVFACVLVMLDAVEVFGVEFVQYVIYLFFQFFSWIAEDPVEHILTLYGLGDVAQFLWRCVRWVEFRS